ncbi:hypothetical protein AA309_26600 [Microvirga vignae]|uniref:Uncharacterized protein n=1 Tax=Microvirga vignae TaxID=1225564 RepID=A0A0H1R5A6_9HYPH|nr:hypothetical protein [Microvirga vignae]KLK90303.1 hypothetical protein AA309_26600 [Microvirga vignae]
MTRKLWSLNGLATELGRDRRTVAKALEAVPADGVLGGHKAWYLKTALDRLKAVTVEEALFDDETGRITKDEADRRRAVALAIIAEVDADEALNRVILREGAEADMAAFCIALKTSLTNAAAKIAGRAAIISSAPEIQELCEAELNRAFDVAQAELVTRWTREDSTAEAAVAP